MSAAFGFASHTDRLAGFIITLARVVPGSFDPDHLPKHNLRVCKRIILDGISHHCTQPLSCLDTALKYNANSTEKTRVVIRYNPQLQVSSVSAR